MLHEFGHHVHHAGEGAAEIWKRAPGGGPVPAAERRGRRAPRTQPAGARARIRRPTQAPRGLRLPARRARDRGRPAAEHAHGSGLRGPLQPDPRDRLPRGLRRRSTRGAPARARPNRPPLCALRPRPPHGARQPTRRPPGRAGARAVQARVSPQRHAAAVGDHATARTVVRRRRLARSHLRRTRDPRVGRAPGGHPRGGHPRRRYSARGGADPRPAPKIPKLRAGQAGQARDQRHSRRDLRSDRDHRADSRRPWPAPSARPGRAS